MPTIPLELPRDLQTFVDSQVRAGQFRTANDYIVALVDAARQNRSAIDLALLEGLDSGPAEEWTSNEWAEIRERVAERGRGS